MDIGELLVWGGIVFAVAFMAYDFVAGRIESAVGRDR